jgi:hypothetical protein
MNRNKPKDEPNSIEDVQQKAFNSMIESLNRYGPTEVLHLLAENSRNDTVCLNLLTRFPTVVSLSEFLHTLPTIKVSKRIFKKLQRKGYVI